MQVQNVSAKNRLCMTLTNVITETDNPEITTYQAKGGFNSLVQKSRVY